MSSEGFWIFICFFLIVVSKVISKEFGSFKSKYNRLRSLSGIYLFFGFVTIFIFGINILYNKASDLKARYLTSADGFTIEEYNVVMNVDTSNVVNVTEYLTVNFYESGHHGIYKFIPFWLKYTNKLGVTQSRESKISNLSASGDDYVVSDVGEKLRIKIGDADTTLDKGMHTYKIFYTYDMGADPYEGFDEFIFHAFGDYWGTEIKNASLTIKLPKKIDDQDNIKFFADKYRKKDITDYVSYSIEGNTIYASLSSNYHLKNSLTVDIELPDGYFVNGSNNYANISLILCILCIVFAVVSFILWLKNGKDLDKVPETVEFYPPENLDAAEIGYLYKQNTGRKLAVALIIELASKGFVKIIESKDKKKQTIIKTKTNEFDNRTKMSSNEQLVYNKLFADSDEVVLSENKSFYEVFNQIYKNVSDSFDDKINDIKSYEYMLISSLGFLICTILWIWCSSNCVFNWKRYI